VVLAIKSGVFSVLHAFQEESGNDGHAWIRPVICILVRLPGGKMFKISASGLCGPVLDLGSRGEHSPTVPARLGRTLTGVAYNNNSVPVLFLVGYGADTSSPPL
jgi:hypothetical protein